VLEQQSLAALVGEEWLERAYAHARASAMSTGVAAPELRPWQRVLMGAAPAPPDDLPDIHLPLRLVAPLPVGERANAALAVLDLPDQVIERALALELAATRTGLTMQAWVLAFALRA